MAVVNLLLCASYSVTRNHGNNTEKLRGRLEDVIQFSSPPQNKGLSLVSDKWHSSGVHLGDNTV